MPADIVGTNVIVEDERGRRRRFEFQHGPIFAQHRAGRRDQPRHAQDAVGAARGDAGALGHGRASRRYELDEPFFVLATQNPLEMEGTYPLPEAQLDRFFFKLHVEFPARDELHAILDRTTGARTPAVRPVLDARADPRDARARARGAGRAARAGLRRARARGDAPGATAARRTVKRSCATALAARRAGDPPRRQDRGAARGPLRGVDRRRARASRCRRCATACSSTSRARPRASRPTRSSRTSWQGAAREA